MGGVLLHIPIVQNKWNDTMNEQNTFYIVKHFNVLRLLPPTCWFICRCCFFLRLWNEWNNRNTVSNCTNGHNSFNIFYIWTPVSTFSNKLLLKKIIFIIHFLIYFMYRIWIWKKSRNGFLFINNFIGKNVEEMYCESSSTSIYTNTS